MGSFEMLQVYAERDRLRDERDAARRQLAASRKFAGGRDRDAAAYHAELEAAQRRIGERPDFNDWLEAWLSGYGAARVTDGDGEALLQAAHDAWKQSGTQRARRVLASGAGDQGEDG